MPGAGREKETARVAGFYGLILLVVLIDQLTKSLALGALAPGESVPVLPGFFQLTLVRNTGIAFGFFRGHGPLLFLVISLCVATLVFWGPQVSGRSAAGRLGLALILGGALGNWIDRLRFGAVVDFLDFRVWPVFNAADSAITVGVAVYLILLVRRSL